MKTKWTILLIAGLSAMAPAVALTQGSDLRPMVVHDVTGNMHIFQSTPVSCKDLNADIPVIGGRFEISPAAGSPLGAARLFVLTKGVVSISPFHVHVSCLGESETRDYTELAVQVMGATSFLAAPSGPPSTYGFSIPAADVLLYEAGTVNGGAENAYAHPRDPVTGTIDLAGGTVKMRVVVATKVDAGALGDFDGSLTTDISGTVAFPDADDDGVPDRSDNCRLVVNADQRPVASPVIRAPADVILHSCLDTRIGRPIAVDVCESRPVVVDSNAPTPFPLATTLVEWSAQDIHGRVAAATQKVTIVDTTSPVITSVPADILLFDCGPADLGLPTATDDCGGTPTFTNDGPANFLAGPTVVTWTARDLSGNPATATQTVTVKDMVPPDVSCGPGTNPSGNGHGGGGFFQVFASDHCDVPVIRLGEFVLAIGENIKITETGRPGVRFVNEMGPLHVRHFQVGAGEGVITATDASGNSARAGCIARRDEDD